MAQVQKNEQDFDLPQLDMLSMPVSERIKIVREGMPWSTVHVFFDSAKITNKDAAQHLSIAERTFARRQKEGHFSPEESNKLYRMMRIFVESSKVFGGIEGARRWLNKPNRSMDGKSPISLLDTDIGAELVLDTLGRIEHGVFS